MSDIFSPIVDTGGELGGGELGGAASQSDQVLQAGGFTQQAFDESNFISNFSSGLNSNSNNLPNSNLNLQTLLGSSVGSIINGASQGIGNGLGNLLNYQISKPLFNAIAAQNTASPFSIGTILLIGGALILAILLLRK